MKSTASELQHLLLDCLTENKAVSAASLAGLLPEEWQDLLALAAVQRVRPLFWHRLKQKGLAGVIPAEAATHLHEAAQRNTMRNLGFYGELRALLTALNAEGIPLILLKGIYLADSVYDNAGLREMSDIDLLARPDRLARVADILAGRGYTSPQPIRPEITLETSHHLPCISKSGFAAFEIHWCIANPGESCSVDHAWPWQHAVPVRVAGRSALALSPEALLLHLCLHTSYQHQFAFGLRPSCDIAALISRFGETLDWETVSDQAERNGWQRGVYLALRLAQELLGARVPGAVLERLRPADMADAVIATVRAQVFGDKQIAASLPLPLAELMESTSILDKIGIFVRRVCLPKTALAACYGVPANSLRLYAFYPYRIFDLLNRHGHKLKRYRQNDLPLKETVERTNIIAAWLSSPPDFKPHSPDTPFLP